MSKLLLATVSAFTLTASVAFADPVTMNFCGDTLRGAPPSCSGVDQDGNNIYVDANGNPVYYGIGIPEVDGSGSRSHVDDVNDIIEDPTLVSTTISYNDDGTTSEVSSNITYGDVVEGGGNSGGDNRGGDLEMDDD